MASPYHFHVVVGGGARTGTDRGRIGIRSSSYVRRLRLFMTALIHDRVKLTLCDEAPLFMSISSV
jgi:hypothetical protein